MKATIIRKKYGTVLFPAYDSDSEKLMTLTPDEEYEVDINKPRNLKFHKKFFALIRACFYHQPYMPGTTNEKFGNEEELRAWLTIEAGYFVEFMTPNGMVKHPQSIRFDKMDDFKFGKLYSAVLDVIIKYLNCNEKEFSEILIDFM